MSVYVLYSFFLLEAFLVFFFLLEFVFFLIHLFSYVYIKDTGSYQCFVKILFSCLYAVSDICKFLFFKLRYSILLRI